MSLNHKTWFKSWRSPLIALLFSYLLVHLGSASKRLRKAGLEDLENSMTSRKSKNLFPFVWVTFQPSPCGSGMTTGDVNKLDGVCVQRGKCSKRGGMQSGGNSMCQDGFGECCTFRDMCNGTRNQIDVNQLVTVLESPTNPNNASCTFRFRKEPNICQIRLDFDKFTMKSADPDGMCLTDRLIISGSITVDRDFTTCGDLTGQHMYLTFGSQDMIEVTPRIRESSSNYRIIATRIPCDSRNRAPDYCLQYFTQTSGTVKSFDYRTGGQQQSNQHYTVCVKPDLQSTQVQWKPCANTGATPAFHIIDNINAMPLTGDDCKTDWVQVKGKDKQCQIFPNPESSTWKPYELLVNFDDGEFPPTPPGFPVTQIPPDACATECPILNIPGYTCACVGTPASCQCIYTATIDPANPDPNAPTIPSLDVNNEGFCLEYNQL